jgi:hypothetical protein
MSRAAFRSPRASRNRELGVIETAGMALSSQVAVRRTKNVAAQNMPIIPEVFWVSTIVLIALIRKIACDVVAAGKKKCLDAPRSRGLSTSHERVKAPTNGAQQIGKKSHCSVL